MSMKPNVEIFADLLDEFKTVLETAARPEKYGIYVTATGLWLGENDHWVQTRETARRFSFVTTAEAYATFELQLDLKAFSVGVL